MRTILPAACLGFVCLTLLGCGETDPPYSQLVTYAVRTDPLVLSDKLIDEKDQPYDPDRPGQLPLMAVADISQVAHPFHARKEDWLKKEFMLDPRQLVKDERDKLDVRLTDIFGTPAHPLVGSTEIGLITDEQRAALKVDMRTLERGSALYRVHCLHCHGVTGDGRGPTARWINPHPRDYRQGIFKFQSVDQTEAPRPPRRDDLHRVIKYGLEGTAMPSFALLGDSEIDLLVSYVIHLSIRGKVEYEAFRNYRLDEETLQLLPNPTRPLDTFLKVMTNNVVNEWIDSQSSEREIKVSRYPYNDSNKEELKASVLRGQTLFQGIGEEGKAANCVNCHIDYGRQAKFRSDAWGTLARPNNLTLGIYRGGRRTVDIYYRIHSGINGSGMASFGKVLKKTKDTDSLWDLVNFVKVLPYPAMRRDLGINLDEPFAPPVQAQKPVAE